MNDYKTIDKNLMKNFFFNRKIDDENLVKSFRIFGDKEMIKN